MISRPRLVALALTAAAVVTQLRVGSADVLEQVLVKVNGDILTKTELEAKQIAAIRGRINSVVDADSMKNNALYSQIAPQVPCSGRAKCFPQFFRVSSCDFVDPF